MEKDERLAILRGLPKVELHRHLEGSLRLSTMLELGRRHGVDLPLDNEEALARVVCFQADEPRTLANFLKKFHSGWYRSYADVERVTTEAIEDAAAQGVVHLELRFSPEHLVRTSRLQPQGVMEAVCEAGRAAAAEASISLRFLVTLTRERYDFSFWRMVVDAAADLSPEGLAGVDLAGDEFAHPNQEYQKIFQRVKDTKVLGISIHAGEGTSAEQVLSAVKLLGADRIGHGTKAVEDESVMEMLAERGIVLEMCPISNYQTGCVDELTRHPLPELDRAGVVTCINADDPSIQRSSLNDEYDVAVTRWTYTLQDLLRLEQNAVGGAFLPDEQREAVLARVEKGYAESKDQGL